MESRREVDVSQIDDSMNIFLNFSCVSPSSFPAVPLQDSHFSSVGGKLMRPSMCHTSSLQIPNDKDQALSVPVRVDS